METVHLRYLQYGSIGTKRRDFVRQLQKTRHYAALDCDEFHIKNLQIQANLSDYATYLSSWLSK